MSLVALLVTSLWVDPVGPAETLGAVVAILLATYGAWKLTDAAVMWFFARFELERIEGRWVRTPRWYAPGEHVDAGLDEPVRVVAVDLDECLDGHRVLVKAGGLEHLVWAPVTRLRPLEDAQAEQDEARDDEDGGVTQVAPGVHLGKDKP
ncbi:hypothetical protein [Actinomadura yumaensis]|uniref:PH domain-containing protein n=1 Tax=Actinomadura yumaensis TaxID=111807 RepID=A0ABW2CNN7_9ACTN